MVSHCSHTCRIVHSRDWLYLKIHEGIRDNLNCHNHAMGEALAADSIFQVSFSSHREGDWQLWHKIELRNIVKRCEVKTAL